MTEIDDVERRRSEFVSVVQPRRLRTRKSLRQRLKTWNTIPDFLRDNEFIRSGYRANLSLKDTVFSLFQLHNETFNIWTHLLGDVTSHQILLERGRTGFLLFLGLTISVATSPPATLTQPRASLGHLWNSVQDKMHSFGDQFGDNVHSLLDAFDLHISDAAAGALHDSMVTIQTHLHENLEHARDSFQAKMEPFSKRMHKSFSALSNGLHQFQNRVGHVAGSINTRLVTVRSNLEKSFNSVQDSLHTLQHDLSGNLGVAKGRLGNALMGLQENLARLQMLLMDARSREKLSSFNNTDSSNQCSNTAIAHYAENLKSVRDQVMRWPTYIYTYGAMFCLLVSSACHLFGCCSKHASMYMWRFDYAGISVLIVTSFYPAVYYSFLCQPFWVVIYLTSTTILGLGTIVASLVSYMQKPKFRRFRALMFCSLGLFGIIPWAHQLLINYNEPTIRTAIVYELIMGALYLGGAGFFVARIPERFKPGAFDIIFHSHQIFHLFVVIAACVHFQAVMHLLEWRESTNGCPLMSHDIQM